MKLIPFQKYEWYWYDIETDNDKWHTADDLIKEKKKKLTYYKNVGYYLGQNKHSFYFCSGISDDGNYFDLSRFPKGVVKRIRKI